MYPGSCIRTDASQSPAACAPPQTLEPPRVTGYHAGAGGACTPARVGGKAPLRRPRQRAVPVRVDVQVCRRVDVWT
eukprot:361545-Chlamydomonas_euryale.AAC.1